MIEDEFVDQLDRAARSPDWRAMLMVGEKGPKANLYNVLMALRHAPDLRGTIRLNAFRLEIDVTAPLPWDDRIHREWSRHDDLHLTEWLQNVGIGVKVADAADGVEAVASEAQYHPVRDWLNGLQWDQRPRVRTWLSYYLGVEDGDYTRAVGARWLISAVARVMRPGCKADHCLVLEGDQGRGKSSALRALVGDEWFTDELADLGSKDAAMQTRGVWVVELAELEHLSKQEVGRIKAFLTRTVDRYRPPYGRRLVMAPRECVFAGTVNDRQYLKDETGNRRFWPVRVGASIDLAALRHDREQIWAEALALWRGGERWWLDGRSLVDLAREEQEARCSVDPWGDKVAEYCGDKGEVTVSAILTEGVGKRLGECTRADEMRVAKLMQQLGWRRGRQSQPPRRWCYVRTAAAGPPEVADDAQA